MSTLSQPAAAIRSRGFMENVLWSWLGVLATFATATLLAPYVFRKLGDEAYGVWSLTFSIIEYFGLLDFGFKSAIIKNAGHYRAQGDAHGINVVVNSALAYFAVVAGVLCGGTVLLVAAASSQFQVSSTYLPDFRLLLLAFGVSWALGLCFSSFTASLEAFQRFDLSSRITVINTVLRASSIAVLLSLGYGLRGAAVAAVACQWAFYLLSLGAFLRVFPEFRLTPSLISRDMLSQLGRFGWHTLPSTIAWLLLLQGPALLIGRLRPTAFVGYYMVAHRLVQTSLELVWRVGSVTNSKTAELASRGAKDDIVRLAQRANRFCFMLYAPVALGAVVYGDRLLATWYSDRLAQESGMVLALLAAASWFAEAGQFNSSSVLFGLGRQRNYSRILLVEAIVVIAGMWWVLPRFSLAAAAAIPAGMMLLHRAILLPVLTSSVLEISAVRYWLGIYSRPLLAASIAALAGWSIRTFWLPGRSLVEVVFASALMTVIYLAALYLFGIEAADRKLLHAQVRQRLGR
jgi:O-antigen/teichoic acid export membrane protein